MTTFMNAVWYLYLLSTTANNLIIIIFSIVTESISQNDEIDFVIIQKIIPWTFAFQRPNS